MGSRPVQRRLVAALCLVLCWVGIADAACRDDTVRLRGEWGEARFTVEIADTPEAQRRGLMFRDSMALSRGMLFTYDRPRRMSFWMRNTRIELDILFIDAQGIVQRIHHEAQPFDETVIDGGRGIAALEINGGLAKRMGIVEGSEVQHPHIPDPSWPC
ncbi:MAG: DUF192 domain-containing protein [Pseudomonadota bacterium]